MTDTKSGADYDAYVQSIRDTIGHLNTMVVQLPAQHVMASVYRDCHRLSRLIGVAVALYPRNIAEDQVMFRKLLKEAQEVLALLDARVKKPRSRSLETRAAVAQA